MVIWEDFEYFEHVFGMWLFCGGNGDKVDDGGGSGGGCEDVFRWVEGCIRGRCVGVMVIGCVEMDVRGGGVGEYLMLV